MKVYRTGDPEHCYRFRYFIEDWDNDRLYIFQLDQRRRATGKNYVLECVVGSMDEDGEMQTTTTNLKLQSTSFQSFYVPEKENLVDVILNDNGNRLRLDKTKLHTGIDLNNRFSFMELSNDFYLDKHENREFMNFNWVGDSSAKYFIQFVEDDPSTDIEAIDTKTMETETDSPVFDLKGRKVADSINSAMLHSRLIPGIYVSGGKKIIVR